MQFYIPPAIIYTCCLYSIKYILLKIFLNVQLHIIVLLLFNALILSDNIAHGQPPSHYKNTKTNF